jgi:hypothetical protein
MTCDSIHPKGVTRMYLDRILSGFSEALANLWYGLWVKWD